MMKILLISIGTISLMVGLIGIFIPVLPTTPFVLLSAGMYIRSSPVLYNRLTNGKVTSRYMTRSAGRKAGIAALVIMWSVIIVTALFFTEAAWLRVLLAFAGLAGTFFKVRYFFRKDNSQIKLQINDQIKN